MRISARPHLSIVTYGMRNPGRDVLCEISGPLSSQIVILGVFGPYNSINFTWYRRLGMQRSLKNHHFIHYARSDSRPHWDSQSVTEMI